MVAAGTDVKSAPALELGGLENDVSTGDVWSSAEVVVSILVVAAAGDFGCDIDVDSIEGSLKVVPTPRVKTEEGVAQH